TAESYLSLGQIQDAQATLSAADQTTVENSDFRVQFMTLQYQIARAIGGIAAQYELLQTFDQQFPHEPERLSFLADYLLDVGKPLEALAGTRKAADEKSK